MIGLKRALNNAKSEVENGEPTDWFSALRELVSAVEEQQDPRESEPTWTNRLNSCKHHGDDHEACAVYGGRVPCDAEGGEAVAFIDPQSLLNFKNEKASLEWAWKCNDGDLIPLYTHPPAAKVPPKLEWRKRVSKWSVFLGGLKNAPIPEHQRNTAASIKKEIDRYLEHGVGHD